MKSNELILFLMRTKKFRENLFNEINLVGRKYNIDFRKITGKKMKNRYYHLKNKFLKERRYDELLELESAYYYRQLLSGRHQMTANFWSGKSVIVPAGIKREREKSTKLVRPDKRKFIRNELKVKELKKDKLLRR